MAILGAATDWHGARVDPLAVKPEDFDPDLGQANDLFLALDPTLRAGSLEEYGLFAKLELVECETLFLGTNKNGDHDVEFFGHTIQVVSLAIFGVQQARLSGTYLMRFADGCSSACSGLRPRLGVTKRLSSRRTSGVIELEAAILNVVVLIGMSLCKR